MFNNSENINKDITESTEAWLNSYSQPSQKPNRTPRKRIILLAMIVILLSTVLLIFFITQKQTSCLTTTDFKNLTNKEFVDDFNSKESFYTFNVNFIANTETYDNTEQSNITVKKIGDYFANNKNKEIIITLSSVYSEEGSIDLANRRISKIRDDLKVAGITDSIIKIGDPVVFPIEELDSISEGYVIFSIVSAEQCR